MALYINLKTNQMHNVLIALTSSPGILLQSDTFHCFWDRSDMLQLCARCEPAH